MEFEFVRPQVADYFFQQNVEKSMKQQYVAMTSYILVHTLAVGG